MVRSFMALLLWSGVLCAQARPEHKDATLPKGAIRQFGSADYRMNGWCMQLSGDGKYIVGNDDHEAIVLDARTGHVVWRRGRLEQTFIAAAFLEGSRTLRLASDNEIEDWDILTWKRSRRISPLTAERSDSSILSEDGSVLVSRRDHQDEMSRLTDLLDCRNAANGKLLASIRQDSNSSAFCISPNGRRIALVQSGSDATPPENRRNTVEVRETWMEVLVGNVPIDSRSVRAMSLSTDGTLLAVCDDVFVHVWNVGKNRRERSWFGDGDVLAVKFARDNKSLFVQTTGAVRRWDLLSGKPGPALRIRNDLVGPRNSGHLNSMQDGRMVLTRNYHHRVELWDLQDRKRTTPATGHPSWVGSVAFAEGGRELRSTSAASPGLRWNISSGELMGPLMRVADGTPEHEWDRVRSPAYLSPDGRFAAVEFSDFSDSPALSLNPSSSLWDSQSETFLADNIGVRSPGIDRDIAYSPDSRLLAVADDGDSDSAAAQLRLIDIETGNPGLTFRTGNYCLATAFSPEGRTIGALLANQNGAADEIRCWDTKTGVELSRHPVPTRDAYDLIFLDHQRILLSVHGIGVDVQPPFVCFDLVRGKEVEWATRPVRAVDDFPVARIPRTPDGRLVAIFTSAGLCTHEVASGTIRHRFTPRSKVHSLAFSPDGKRLASGHQDTTVILWDLGPTSDLAAPSDLAALWKAIQAREAEPAWAAMAQLISHPARTVPYLCGQVKPEPVTPPVDQVRIARLIEQLDASSFTDREAAGDELVRLGAVARPAVDVARKKPASSETIRRLAVIWDRIHSRDEDLLSLGRLRAIEVLEWIGSPSAVEHLKKIAAGGDAPSTRAARSALDRLQANIR